MDRQHKPAKTRQENSSVLDQPLESYSDQELLEELKNGNETGFDVLVKRYQTRIYQLAWRMVRNQEDAWELAQETFVRAYRAIPKFKGKSSFYTWLYRICFNLSITFSKKKQKDKKMVSLNTLSEDILMLETVNPSNGPRQSEILEKQHKLSSAISKAIGQLPLQQKIVFTMRQYDEMNNEEIANALNISVSGVKSNYYQAIKKLQVLLKEWL